MVPADRGEGSGIENPLDRVEALFQSTGDHRLIQWLCQRAGVSLFSTPRTPASHVPDSGHKPIVQDFADLLQVIAAAAADNQITPPRPNKSGPLEELKSVTEVLWRVARRATSTK